MTSRLPRFEDVADALRQGLEGLYSWADGKYGRHENIAGEWECEYPAWHEIWPPVEQLILLGEERALGREVVELVLDAMARDNETEQIADFVAERPNVVEVVATAAVRHRDPGARWQAAVAVGRCASIGPDEAERLLVPFRADNDEYVRRRAMLALSRKAPRSPEVLAWAMEAWASGHEYQRMAALEVVHSARDARFQEWALEASRGSDGHLRAFASKMVLAEGG